MSDPIQVKRAKARSLLVKVSKEHLDKLDNAFIEIVEPARLVWAEAVKGSNPVQEDGTAFLPDLAPASEVHVRLCGKEKDGGKDVKRELQKLKTLTEQEHIVALEEEVSRLQAELQAPARPAAGAGVPAEERKAPHATVATATDGTGEEAELERELEKITSDASAETVAGLQADIAKLRAENETLQQQLAQEHKGAEEVNAKLEAAQQVVQATRDTVAAVREQLDKANAELEQLRGQVQEREHGLDAAREEIDRVRREHEESLAALKKEHAEETEQLRKQVVDFMAVAAVPGGSGELESPRTMAPSPATADPKHDSDPSSVVRSSPEKPAGAPRATPAPPGAEPDATHVASLEEQLAALQTDVDRLMFLLEEWESGRRVWPGMVPDPADPRPTSDQLLAQQTTTFINSVWRTCPMPTEGHINDIKVRVELAKASVIVQDAYMRWGFATARNVDNHELLVATGVVKDILENMSKDAFMDEESLLASGCNFVLYMCKSRVGFEALLTANVADCLARVLNRSAMVPTLYDCARRASQAYVRMMDAPTV